ncbi:hypothetical protein F3Y22_tig00011761pilonHSYRG00175 [Hibiscus syriacus]|uniref:Uncharacterized protein n=1 Tax=Hibiscus syriacus TaxID=106335 RepID=A0A6A3C9K9_HIBSY|nr:hypothetical protein F3Y22_tig00011761pilonHSYRG00175 [Hibiscus syriacus]
MMFKLSFVGSVVLPSGRSRGCTPVSHQGYGGDSPRGGEVVSGIIWKNLMRRSSSGSDSGDELAAGAVLFTALTLLLFVCVLSELLASPPATNPTSTCRKISLSEFKTDTCAAPVQVAPSKYSSDGGRRWTQALGKCSSDGGLLLF